MTHVATRRIEWDAGHRVPLHASKCRTPHGHRYAAEITVAADSLSGEGFVVDFGVVKTLVGGWVDEHWDHTMIFEVGDELMEAMRGVAERDGLRQWYAMPYAPTAENMARHLFEVAVGLLADSRVRVDRVRIYETPNCWADWYPR